MQELMPAASPYQGSELSGAVQQPLQLGHHHHHQVQTGLCVTTALGVGVGGSTKTFSNNYRVE